MSYMWWVDVGAHLGCRSIVMRTCRADGVLLRPSLPLATLDLAFTKPTGKPNDNSAAPLWWAAHDNHGALRWSYFLSINSDAAVSVDPATLLWEDAAAAMAAWVVDLESNVTQVCENCESPLHTPTLSSDTPQ